MNKLFLKIATLTAGVTMAIGVGVGLSSHKEAKSVSAASTTVEKTTNSLVTELNWTVSTSGNEVCYTSWNLDDNITISTSGSANCGSVWGTTAKDWRLYQAKNGDVTATAKAGYKIVSLTYTYGNKNTGTLKDGTTTVASDTIVNVNATSKTLTVGNTGSATNGQVKITNFKVIYDVNASPAVSIDNAPTNNLSIGDKGTFTATPVNATDPVLAWESDDASVVAITEGGAFEAKGAGKTKIRVNMTCTEGNASAEADVIVDVGLITIAEANEIASHLTSGSTTPFKVTVEGFLTNFNADSQTSGKERALTLSTAKVGETGTDLMVFGVYSSAEIRNYGILNATARWTGNLQNYNSTYELTSPQLVSYTDEAIQYATAAYSYLNETCIGGAEAVTDQQWNKLAQDFEDIDEYAQAKLAAASSSYAYNEAIKNWIGRYEIIVSSGKSNFMNNTTVSSNIVSNNDTNDNVVPMVLIVIVSVAFSMGAMWIVLRKKRLSK